jgi:hypothetical protein
MKAVSNSSILIALINLLCQLEVDLTGYDFFG